MASDFYYPTTKNGIQKLLAAQLLSTATTGDAITFDDVEGLDNVPGVLVINRINSNGESTPSSREFISYTGTAGNTVLIETRNVDSSGAARTHAVGSIVEFVADAVWAKRVIDQIKVEHNQDGTHSDITADSADITAITADSIAVLATDVNFSWLNVTDTWAYASATTVTVPSGAASLYQKGDKLRLKQGAGYKYFYIVGVADTVLTVTGGSDFTVADAAITDIAISRASSPFGFPGFFNWTPTISGFATAPTITSAYFSLTGLSVNGHFETATHASNGTTFDISTPITAVKGASGGIFIIFNNSTWQATPGKWEIQAANYNLIKTFTDSFTTAWSASNNKRTAFRFLFEI
jgi:hypothetical protein